MLLRVSHMSGSVLGIGDVTYIFLFVSKFLAFMELTSQEAEVGMNR